MKIWAQDEKKVDQNQNKCSVFYLRYNSKNFLNGHINKQCFWDIVKGAACLTSMDSYIIQQFFQQKVIRNKLCLNSKATNIYSSID